MGNMVSIVGGAVAVILGLTGLIIWWGDFIVIIKGMLPIFLLLGGLIAVLAGLSDMKESSKR